MSILETLLIFGGIPLAIYLILAFLSTRGKPYAGTAPKHYDLRGQWTHEPVLWSAVDEVTTHAHHGHRELTAAPRDMIGGSASGKW